MDTPFSGPLIFEQSVEISASPEIVWRALIDPKIVSSYHLAPLYRMELFPGGQVIFGDSGNPMISGRVVEVQPARLLSHSFRFGAENHAGAEANPDTLVTYHLEPLHEVTTTRLTLRHSGFTEENQTWANISGGWPFILERLAAHLT